jgi:hypothetical protein
MEKKRWAISTGTPLFFMKLLLLILLLLATLSAIILLHAEGRKMAASHPQQPLRSIKANITRKLQQKSRAALAFAQQKGFNTRFCFFADMSLHSGSSRFFVYSLTGDSVLMSGLVTHGRCNEWWLEGRKYSNTKGSGCTSLGRYKVGAAYQGRFGLALNFMGWTALIAMHFPAILCCMHTPVYRKLKPPMKFARATAVLLFRHCFCNSFQLF